jgi:hypothetical protein
MKIVNVKILKPTIIPVLLCWYPAWSLTSINKTQIEGVLEGGAGENVWYQERGGSRRLEG